LLVVKIGESKHEGGFWGGRTEKHGSCVSCASKEGEWEFGGLSTDMAHDQWPNLDQFSLFLAN
jgi:hypothetical protein